MASKYQQHPLEKAFQDWHRSERYGQAAASPGETVNSGSGGESPRRMNIRGHAMAIVESLTGLLSPHDPVDHEMAVDAVERGLRDMLEHLGVKTDG
jgi:hypothetical protein